MTFWQENYPFIKDVYLMRQTKMVEWMENVEKAISRIMADKVYTSAEFKRERDNFHVRFLSLLPPCRASRASSIIKMYPGLLSYFLRIFGRDSF